MKSAFLTAVLATVLATGAFASIPETQLDSVEITTYSGADVAILSDAVVDRLVGETYGTPSSLELSQLVQTAYMQIN